MKLVCVLVERVSVRASGRLAKVSTVTIIPTVVTELLSADLTDLDTDRASPVVEVAFFLTTFLFVAPVVDTATGVDDLDLLRPVTDAMPIKVGMNGKRCSR